MAPALIRWPWTRWPDEGPPARVMFSPRSALAVRSCKTLIPSLMTLERTDSFRELTTYIMKSFEEAAGPFHRELMAWPNEARPASKFLPAPYPPAGFLHVADISTYVKTSPRPKA